MQEPSGQAEETEGEGTLVPLTPPVRPLAGEGLALHALDDGGERTEAGVGRREPEHAPAGAVGNGLEGRGVQTRNHRRPGGIALVSGLPTVRVELGHRLPGLGADPHSVHDDPRLLRALDGLVDVALEVLPVGDEDQHLVAALLVDEGVEALREADPEGRAGRGHDAGLDGLEEQPHRVGVQREGGERVGLSFERDQGEAVPFEARHELQEGLPGQEEPVGCHVRGGHRTRRVEGQHHVHALALDLLAHDPPLRPGQGHDHSRRAEQQQGKANPPPALVGAAHHAAPEGPGHQPGEPVPVPTHQPHLEPDREGQREEREEPTGGLEDHDGLLMPAPPSGRWPRPARPPANSAAAASSTGG